MSGLLSGYQKSWFRHDLLAGVSVAAAKGPVRAILDRAALAGRIAPERMFPTVAAAVEELTKTGHFGLP